MIRHNRLAQRLPKRVAAAAPVAGRRRGRHIRTRVPLGLLALLVCGVGLLVWRDPSVVPQAVDLARAIVGPGSVAQVESVVFQAQDSLRQARYQATGASSSSVRWAAPAAPPPAARPVARPTPGVTSTATLAQAQEREPQDTAPTGPALAWSPFVYTPDVQPVLERALVSPDSTRPYVETALVRIDLRLAQLHLVAGTQEPVSKVHTPRPGAIPLADQRVGRLLAAFNGGFKAANGAFGMAVDRVTLLPPIDGLATLAFYRDGRTSLGAWGKDIKPAPDLVAYRQNCPLLLDGGLPTSFADTDDPALWGKTVKNKIATWRSGLGLSADGRYLIYAAGDGLTVPALAQALQSAGATRAMQLDINSWWTRFVTYALNDRSNHLVAQKLLQDMVGDQRQFLAPDSRDFFYVTAR